MTISPMQRLVQVIYRIPRPQGGFEVQVEEWTLHQCIVEKVPQTVLDQLLEDQVSENPSAIVLADSDKHYPVSYKLRPEYNSEYKCKRTISIQIEEEVEWLEFD